MPLQGLLAPPAADPYVFSSPQPEMRDMWDSGKVRQLVFTKALDAARAIKPIDNKKHLLELADVDYADPDHFSLADQKKAILESRTLARRMRGTWRLKDAITGDTLSEKKSTIASIPYMTDRGTFILNGTEYTLSNQMRLKSGVFTRMKNNGDLDVHVNILPGKGLSHHYEFSPANNIFKMKLQQSSMPLMPLLKAMGVSDSKLREAWGNEIYAANARVTDDRVVDRLYEKLIRNPDPAVEKHTAVAEAFRKMETDPDVNLRTLGKAFSNVNEDTVLEATKKLLAVHRGEKEVDDRDHMAYQTFMGPEDLISERLSKSAPAIRSALWKASFKGSLDHLQPGTLDDNVKAVFILSGLGQAAEEINPSEILDAQSRVTRLGEGGIPGVRAVPEEARNVQPSHLNIIDPVRAPESLKIGVDSRTAFATKKGADGNLYSPYIDQKTGKTVYKTPRDVADSVIAFPGELNKGKAVVAAMSKGKLGFVKPEAVDFVIPHMENTFSPLANMIPMKSAVKAQRVAMGSRMTAQALPLINPEAPYVRSAMPDNPNKSFEEHYGTHMGAVRATDLGKIMKVTPDDITVKYRDGSTKTHELYNNFLYNRKTGIYNTPLVRPGDIVGPSQLLAKSNYTDDQGATALGLNARVAYLPYQGKNFEDASVISESMAKRMTSEHMYANDVEWEPSDKKGKKAFVGIFAAKYDKKILDNMDDDGVVTEGTKVYSGDPLILRAQEKALSHNQLVRSAKASFSDNSVLWDHDHPGVVTDVAKTKKGVLVTVKSMSPAVQGDKVSGRYGDKGVIAEVVPDDKMPKDSQGRPFEVLVSPLSLISRVNPAQMVEAALGKISEKTGKPYMINDFSDIEDLSEYALQELAKHGLQDTEDIVDPISGRTIPGVFTGNRFFMKLHHMAEGKAQGRGTGGYTTDETPAKGGAGGSKRIGMGDLTAVLSHGAPLLLQDFKLIKGQRNEDWWQKFMSGYTPPTPKVPFIHEKFVNMLRAAGINPVRENHRTHLMAMTDKNVEQLAEDREIKNSETVDWKGGMKPIPGGLFDPALTGGNRGNRWSFIRLSEPMPNPLMEEPIRKVLGLTANDLNDVIGGRKGIADGKVISPEARSDFDDYMAGPQAIARALSGINVDKEIQKAVAEVRGSKRTARDSAIKKLKFLAGARDTGVHPKDWMISKLPVLPPVFRAVDKMKGANMTLVPDPNYLYKEVMDADEALKGISGKADSHEERVNLYNSIKAVQGLGDPTTPKNVERGVKGILKHIFGPSPKFGMVQRKLLGMPVDVVGRSTIVPNPDLDMDQIGLPEETAWDIYKPFIIRRLVRRGMAGVDAATAVNDRSTLAKNAMLEEISDRPVVTHRAPVLHRYGFMSFYPRLVKGHVIQINPFVVKGFGADFDGDAMNFHVPVMEDAKREAVEKMLPSKNLFSVSKFDVHYLPITEHASGLYIASNKKNKTVKPRVFASKNDALVAYKRGEIDEGDPIEIYG